MTIPGFQWRSPLYSSILKNDIIFWDAVVIVRVRRGGKVYEDRLVHGGICLLEIEWMAFGHSFRAYALCLHVGEGTVSRSVTASREEDCMQTVSRQVGFGGRFVSRLCLADEMPAVRVPLSHWDNGHKLDISCQIGSGLEAGRRLGRDGIMTRGVACSC
jgi:hypothetical protein